MTSELIINKLNEFFSQYHLSRYGKDETIINADDDPKSVFYLKSGYVRLYSISPNGQELTFNIFKPGSYFSMMWAISDIPNKYYFQAITNVEVWKAPKEATTEFLIKNPDILFELTKRILIGLSGTLTAMEYLLFGNAGNKVASVLMTCVKRFGEPDGVGQLINLSLTHQDIANLASLTRETTSVEMKKLEKLGIIVYENHMIVVRNLEKLEVVAAINQINSESLPASI